ncbi:chemotaxis protein CheW [Fischerella sp. PCC 9605]|uniref:chemotaxis protein CheW n=1 Tax=Fischerella sp. PCC 9605 TaxID=1173024 RepID=UPI00047BDE15|nr:chemotaxis protein CheW [Fischerella sp. PCC 9605]
MKEHFYLTFSLNNYLCGISTVYVEEIAALPELTLIPEAPREIVGVFNLRGDIVPVMDLNILFGYQSPDYHLTNSIVVLRSEGLRLGIIVNQVHKVKDISLEEITTELDCKQELLIVEQIKKIITGVARIGRDIFILSNPENWLSYAEKQQVLSLKNFLLEQKTFLSHNIYESQPNDSELLLFQEHDSHYNRELRNAHTVGLRGNPCNTLPLVFCPNATLEERTIFRQRAVNLSLPLESQDFNKFTTLAVIALNGYLFGINLEMVREFTVIRQVTPIPCCSAHIIGNMNLRGEVLTLVDIRGLLNLPPKGILDGSKAMVVEVEGIVAGVIVEEVCDVMFSLNLQNITAVPTAIHSISDEYFQGAASYHEKIISILDIPKIWRCLIEG